MKNYILEVQKYYSNVDPQMNGKSEHVGYMNVIFKSKKEACDYYNKFNPHMRSLNAHGNYSSDWDPKTCLMYVIREFHYENRNLPTFEEKIIM